MTIQSGTHLGPYEVLSAIGAGGMGEVYRARDTKLDRDVAIKVLPDLFARDPDRMARFQREAKVLASLNHPNIASIYGLEDSGSAHALVMELVEGPTLADRIRSGPIPISEALPIARQICDALEYAHERGIVHRDLKPANVKVTKDDAVKVLDFGLAKALEGDAASVDISTSPTLSRLATMQGVLLGTAAYMSPEQAKAKAVDRRADIWAFGCVLYEMLTGKIAFSGETVTDTLAAVVRAEPEWSLLPSTTPVRVRALLQRCLQKDPKQRLQAIGEARIALDETLSGAPEAMELNSPARRRRYKALPWVLFGATAVALAVLTFVYFRENSPAPAASLIRFEIPAPEKVTLGPDFTVSPDGRKLVFAAIGSDGVGRLWLRSFDSLEARPLPGTERTGGTQPPFFWSPDSRFIAFDATGKLKKLDVSGGAAETLCDAPALVVGGSWNRDGVIIFGQSGGGAIMRVSASGGDASPLTTVDTSRGEVLHVLPQFLPDGRHFLYLRVSSNPEATGTYVGSLDAKPKEQDLKRLVSGSLATIYTLPSGAELGKLLFMRNGALMAQPFDTNRLQLVGEPVTLAESVETYNTRGFFSASNNGALVYRTGSGSAGNQLTWFDRQGKILGTAGERGAYSDPALSPDGMRAAVVRSDSGKGSVWLVDFSRGITTRFTFGSADARDPVWSGDGKRIIFMSNPNGDLYEKPADGSAQEALLLKSDQLKDPEDVSRDGRFLLYMVLDPKTKADLWVLPLTGDKKPFPFVQTAFNEHSAKFSPDDHWIAYTSDESGRDEIYVRKFSPDATVASSESSGKWQVSYDGGREPWWSGDGKQLYYLTLDSKVTVVDVTTNPSFQAGPAKTLFQSTLGQGNGVPTGDYTVDGKRFLFLAPADEGGQAQAPFTVVLNWQEGLKAQQ